MVKAIRKCAECGQIYTPVVSKIRHCRIFAQLVLVKGVIMQYIKIKFAKNAENHL